MNLNEKIIYFCAPRGRHGPKLKIRKRPKKSSAPNFKNPKKYFLYVLKGLFQHIKDLRSHFLISESYSKKGVLTACQKQILGFDLF
jgi:hypothetical protein